MSITKTMPCPSGLCRALFPVLLLMFQLVLPEAGGARSTCSFPPPDQGLKIACDSLNLLKAEKRSHGYAFDKRYAGYRELRRDPCPNCPDPDKRRLAIMMANRQGGSAQAYYDKLTDPEFVKKRVENNVAGLAAIGSMFLPLPRILGLGSKGAVRGGVEVLKAGEYTITKTVANNLATRPYINSPSIIKDIIKSGKGVADQFFKGGVNYKVPGTFNGSKGIFELGINPETNTIYHFLFKAIK